MFFSPKCPTVNPAMRHFGGKRKCITFVRCYGEFSADRRTVQVIR